ncbi:hypothetical protein ABH973_002612 [Bradyrhizobium ottawaense]
MYVSAKPIQLSYSYVAPELPCGSESRLQLRSAVQSIRALACLHLNKLTGHFISLSSREVSEGVPLSFDAQA